MGAGAINKVKAVGATATGGVVGALAGGPIGMGVGLAVGGVIDWWRRKKRIGNTTTYGNMPPVSGSGGGLPPSANLAAAASATRMLAIGRPQNAAPWLRQFQASVGLPATGTLDPMTRSMLVLATAGTQYDASKLP